jgi:2-dehydro-3-deoxyphosphogluconate aldolase/(4S)-4-hydroxy-2-oxoglutarate aldolase
VKLRETLARVVAVPVITAGDVAETVDLCKALAAGGLDMLEITLRSPTALAAVEAAARALPLACVGVGTLIDPRDVQRVANAGARFAVSPGYTSALAELTLGAGLDWLPGAVTASEIMLARSSGHTTLKFFPSLAFGGPEALRAYQPVFPDVKFCPTGGINQKSAADYLACANVVAIGGTWMMPKEALVARDWAAIERAAREAHTLRG